MLAPAIVDKAGAEAEFSGISATIDALERMATGGERICSNTQARVTPWRTRYGRTYARFSAIRRFWNRRMTNISTQSNRVAGALEDRSFE